MSFPSLQRTAVFKSELPPCSLRIKDHYLYLGTYKLVEGENRYGSIEVWDIAAPEPTLAKSYPTNGAILDLKVDPFDESRMCSCDSKGSIILWKVDSEDPTKLTQLADRRLFNEHILITAVNFHKTKQNLLVLTTTSGVCSFYDIESDKLTDFDTGHDLECWYADFGAQPATENLVISGGDDRKLVVHDMRAPQQAVWSDDRIHGAGVVSVLTSSKDWCSGTPNAFWTGSYDDHVRCFDLRYLPGTGAYPKVSETLALGGGVWKLIPSPDAADHRVLTCCMYDGARLLSYDAESGGTEIAVENYFKRDHSSITYGGDWQGDVIATCSFYDNVVQVWADTKAEAEN